MWGGGWVRDENGLGCCLSQMRRFWEVLQEAVYVGDQKGGREEAQFLAEDHVVLAGVAMSKKTDMEGALSFQLMKNILLSLKKEVDRRLDILEWALT